MHLHLIKQNNNKRWGLCLLISENHWFTLHFHTEFNIYIYIFLFQFFPSFCLSIYFRKHFRLIQLMCLRIVGDKRTGLVTMKKMFGSFFNWKVGLTCIQVLYWVLQVLLFFCEWSISSSLYSLCFFHSKMCTIACDGFITQSYSLCEVFFYIVTCHGFV